MDEPPPDRELLPAGYAETLEAIKAEVRSAQIRVARTANTQMIELYWRLGQLIVQRQLHEGRRARVIARLAADLQTEFPDVRGFSAGNLDYMRRFATAWPEVSSLQVVGKLGWGQIQTLLDRLDNREDRDWYATRSTSLGWSRNTLVHHITTHLKLRTGTAPDNFTTTLPATDSDAVRELVHDPVRLDFLTLDPGFSERQLEDALVTHLTHLIAELGHGFAFVGRQVPLRVGDRELFVDLLFYHLGLRRFIVFELKIGEADSRDVGQLSTYIAVVDEQLRQHERGDEATIGILLAAARDEIFIQYALRASTAPMAVLTYTTDTELPAAVRPALPSTADLTRLVRSVQHHST